jgi:Ca2+-transporting ATPase
LKGLRSVLAADARLIRDGIERRMPATEVVAGDIALVYASEAFPADGVIVRGDRLQADESSLTGEAYPVIKRAGAGPPAEAVTESNWVFAGTRLLTGEARVRVIFTGGDTVYGEIVQAAQTTRRQRTPLQQAVARLVRSLLVVAAGACLLLAAVRLAQGYGPVDAFVSAAVLAVAAIPEEFPVVLTFFLGLGVYRLAQRKTLVRQAVAVENIGRVAAICSDKTGTITEGRLALHELHPAAGTTPERLVELGRMASRPETHDPLDEVLLATPATAATGRMLAVFPFTEARRREVAIWDHGGRLIAAAKGAPEAIVMLCNLDEAGKTSVLEEVAGLSSRGQKVIACASRPIDIPSIEPLDGFSYAGLIGISDPLRAGVRDAARIAGEAGIRIVMVTGDHPQTAAAIAREAGLASEPVILTGDDLEAMLKRDGAPFLDHLDAVARATPAQKVMVVEALRKAGLITAVTGDGVNDVPALKAADVGIAMGLRGTRSAREVASIILLDDNFSTIVHAIAEGRQLFRNLASSFAFLLMVHVPLVSTAALIPLLGYPLLYLPIHIVLLELIIHPAAILGFQQRASDGLSGPGQRTERFFTRAQGVTVGLTGTTMALAVASLFILAIEGGETIEHARTLGLVALVTGMIAILAILTRLRGIAPKVLSMAGLLAAVGSTGIPVLATAIHLHPLGERDWLVAATLGALAALPSWGFARRAA